MTLTQLLFSFKGRINRKPWWLASLGAGFAASLLTAILEAVARFAGETIVNPVTHQFEPILIIVAIAVVKEQGALWYALAGAAGLAAFAISVWLFVQIGFLRGTEGPNRFGPDPLGAARDDAQL